MVIVVRQKVVVQVVRHCSLVLVRYGSPTGTLTDEKLDYENECRAGNQPSLVLHAAESLGAHSSSACTLQTTTTGRHK